MSREPRCWIVDQRHYLDVLDPMQVNDIPAPARRVASFMGDIVRGVTAGWDDPAEGCATTVRCMGRVGRRRCTDHVVARVLPGGEIQWVCPNCGEDGLISHWRETPWNLSDVGKRTFPAMDVLRELGMSHTEYEAVRSILVLDAEAERVLHAGRVPFDDVIIAAPRAWIVHLLEFIAAESNHTRSKKKEALYAAVLDRADGDLARERF